eukprot:13787875-Alexandrium_andersonii.AAC.1
MDSGMDLLSDLLGPLGDPLQDDSLVRSSDHDSSVSSVQRQVISRSAHATSHTRAMLSAQVSGGRNGVQDRSPPTT